MTRGWSLLTLAGLTAALAAPAAPAQAPQFRWQPGQVLTYKVAQVTTAAETVKEGKLDTTTRRSCLRWSVSLVAERCAPFSKAEVDIAGPLVRCGMTVHAWTSGVDRAAGPVVLEPAGPSDARRRTSHCRDDRV